MPVIAAPGFLCGITEGLIEVIWITALQQRVTPGALARVSASDTMGAFALMPVGFALAGPAAEAFGTKEVLFAAAGFAAGVEPVVATLSSVRGFRRLS